MRVTRDPNVPKAPHDWIDEVVVERLVNGRNPGPRYPSYAERAEAARILISRGFGPTQIAARLRTSGAFAAQLYRQEAFHSSSQAVA